MIRKSLFGFVSILAIVAASSVAVAQSADSTSGATSSSGAVSGSRSSSGAVSSSGGNRTTQTNAQTQGVTSTTQTGVTLNQTSNTPAQQGVNYSGGTNNSSWSGGDQTIRAAPMVYAPPVSGGNPCTLAVSGGVSVIGWGASAGGTFVDQDCANRQKIAMVHNAGYQQAARELMCNDKDTYIAFRGSATPCAWRAQFEGNAPSPTMVQQPAPTPIVAPAPMVQVTPKVYPRCDARRGIVDNCAS